MTLRYLAVVLLLSAIGAGLLGLRQQQLNDKHAVAESHTQMKLDREAIKDLQVRIAKRTTPEALQAMIEGADLRLEPITQPVQAKADTDTGSESGDAADAEDPSDG